MRKRSFIWGLVLLSGMLLGPALDLGAGSAAAAPRPAREQRMPALAYNPTLGDEQFVVVWVEDRGSGPDLFLKRLAANGMPRGGADAGGSQVIRPDANRPGEPAGPRSDPAIVYNAQQNEYLLVYSEFAGNVEGWNVFGVRVNTAGYASGQPRLLAGGPGDQQRPDLDLIPLRDGADPVREDRDYLVVFDDNSRDVDAVWGLRVRGNGIARGKPFRLVENPSSNASDPTTNGTAVAWVDDRDGQLDLWGLRLREGLPNGMAYRLAGDDFADDFNPRYGGSGLIWNVTDPGTGTDIRGAEVYANNRTRGPNIGILVPAADQSWPDSVAGREGETLIVFADNRSGEFDLWAMRTQRLRPRGGEFPIVADAILP